MLSFIDYEKKSNPIILGLCRSNSPIITQLLSLKNGRFLVPQSVALMDRPAAVNTDDFLRDHAVVLSDKHTDGKKGTQQQQQQQQQRQLFLSLNGVFGTYDEAETQILTVMGRVAISSPDIFFKSSQNVERFFEANSSVLAKEDVTTGAQATIVLLREDTLKRANGTDLPFTLISEFVDSKSYQLIQLNAAESSFDAKSPSPSLSGGGGSNKQITTANLIDFGTDVSSPSPLTGVVGNTDATRPETSVEGRVEEGEGRENFLLGTNYEADAEGKDDFFVNVFARDKLFTEQVRPRLDEFIQKFVTDHAVCRSADGKAVQDEISQVKATLVLNSGFASNEAQNASIICGLENYLMSNLHKVLFPTETAKDKEFEQKARSLWFVSAEHLDVPSECLDHFAPIVAQLQRIGEYKTPGNKLFVVSEVCKALYSLCSRKDRKACSTDDFLPCLIFVVLKSGLRNVVSTLEYIQNCHSPLFLQKEALYYLTNMLSAVGFIQGVSEKSLSIRKSTYDRLCSLAPPTGLPSLRPDLSVAYTFGDVSPCDLRVGDIPNLLDQYKELLEFFSKHQHEKKDSTNNDNNNYKMKN